MSYKVTGAINGGEHDGKRYTIKSGFKTSLEALKFLVKYNEKQGRRFYNLEVESE